MLPTARWTWLSTSSRQLNAPDRGGSKSPDHQPAVGILRSRHSSRYDHDISTGYDTDCPFTRYNSTGQIWDSGRTQIRGTRAPLLRGHGRQWHGRAADHRQLRGRPAGQAQRLARIGTVDVLIGAGPA